MNILGEGFPQEIIDQISQRQKAYGAGYAEGTTRSSENLIYLNGNTSWCKLVSSVNIDDQTVIQDKSLSKLTGIQDNNLAKQFVLFNGTNNSNAKSNQRAGISIDKNVLGGNSAYGIGGTDFGIRPMMGIQSVDVKHENRGSIRRASVKIKAFNKIQFDIIDVLYLRLGFNVLLEWGHSMYYDNNGELQTGSDIDNSLATEFLEGKGQKIFTPTPGSFVKGTTTTLPLTYEEFLEKIANKRISSNGNYDAMFAKITNFHWSFLPDGSYDITIDLVSVGDVVESFKINALIDGLTINANAPVIDPSTSTNEEIINYYENKNSIGKFFYNLLQKFGKTSTTITGGGGGLAGGLVGSTTLTSFSNTTATSDEIITNKIDAITINYSNQKSIFYVRLGTLLQFFQEKLMYAVKVGNSYSPLLKFDYDVETNLMYVGDLQVSVDPTICVVNRELQIDPGVFYPFAPDGEPFESPLLGSSYGQIMNIYVSMAWILLKMDELKDASNNKVILIDLLNNMLSAINGSLGGTIKLEASIDDSRNTVVIIDGNPLPNVENVITTLNKSGSIKINDKYARFDLYGYTDNAGTGSAGFIKDFSLTTEISPELSTMLTVGATANSAVVGENSTAFSKFNAGLKDRYKEEIVYLPPQSIGGSNTGPINYFPPNIIQQFQSGQQQQALINSLALKYAKTFQAYKDYLKNLSNKIYNGDADTYKDAVVNYTNYQNQLRQTILVNTFKSKNLSLASLPSSFVPGTGFIPFNMSLTMDGLSGMKIYSKFFIDTKFLPANYPDNAEFLIKNIAHKIENNKWFTTLESVVISKGDANPQTLNSKPNLSGNVQNQNQNQSSINYLNTPPPTDGQPSVLLDRELQAPRISPAPISVADLVKRLHPQVQSTFTNFFNDIIANFPGYDIIINDTYRTFAQSAALRSSNSKNAPPGESPHNYGYAIDLNLKNRKTGKVYLKNGNPSEWLATGFVDKAANYGIKWGNFAGYTDLVHFYVDFNRDATLINVKKLYPTFDPNNLKTAAQVDGRKVKVV